MSNQANRGVILSGDAQINARNLAVGDYAAIYEIAGSDKRAGDKRWREVQDRLAQLITQLQENKIPEQEALIAETHQVARELTKAEPSKRSVNSMLSGIADGVKSVSTIAATVEAIKAAVLAVFS